MRKKTKKIKRAASLDIPSNTTSGAFPKDTRYKNAAKKNKFKK